MTEKERIIRKAARDRADFLEDQNRLTWADDIRQALADTEDTGGDISPETKEAFNTFVRENIGQSTSRLEPLHTEDTGGEKCPDCKGLGERFDTLGPGPGEHKKCCLCNGTGRLPPKEQDDEAMETAFIQFIIDKHGSYIRSEIKPFWVDIWKSACKWMRR